MSTTILRPTTYVGADGGSAWTSAPDNALNDDSDSTYGYIAVNADRLSLPASCAEYNLSDTASDFTTAISGTVNVKYRWDNSTHTSPYYATSKLWPSLGVRVVKSDGSTVLASATGAVNMQTVASSITAETATWSGEISFGYVDPDATKTDWDGAKIQIGITTDKVGGGNAFWQCVLEAKVTLAYTASTAYDEGVSETVEEAESVGAVLGAVVGTAETVEVGEALGSLATYTVALAETVEVGEAVAAGQAYTADVAEAVEVGEAVGAVLAANVALAETVEADESTGSLFVGLVGLDETVELSEEVLVAYAAILGVNETVEVGEQVEEAYVPGGGTHYDGNVNEAVEVGEAVGTALACVVSLAEAVEVGESVSAVVATAASVAETVEIGESALAAYAAVLGVAESVKVGEQVQEVWTPSGAHYSEALAESVVVVESIVTVAVYLVPLDEEVDIEEGIQAIVPESRGLGALLACYKKHNTPWASMATQRRSREPWEDR